MPPHYTTCPIPGDKIDQAFPVARLIDASLTLDAWRRMCGAYSCGRESSDAFAAANSVLAVLDLRGFVRGLCLVNVATGADGSRTLNASVQAGAAGLDIACIMAAIMRGLIGQCRESGCAGLTIVVPVCDEPMLAALERAYDDVPLLARSLSIDVVREGSLTAPAMC